MSVARYSIFLLIISALSYIWVISPSLSSYSFQVFALGICALLFIRKLTRRGLFSSYTANGSSTKIQTYELLALSGLCFLFIGGNNTHPGIIYPIISIYLFLVVFFLDFLSALVTTVVLTAFLMFTHLFTQPSDYAHLLIIPLLFTLFYFAKRQYDLTKTQQAIIISEEETLAIVTTDERQLFSFLTEFLQPKIELMRKLVEEPVNNTSILQSQLSLIESEIQKQLKKISSNSDTQ